MKTTTRFVIPCLLAALLSGVAASAQQSDIREQREVAGGVVYRHIRRATPTGELWSVHVVEVSRADNKVEVRAVRGAGTEGEMQWERPTEMARRAMGGGLNVVAVVNGDYDLAAPYLGVSDGLVVTDAKITTSGKPSWPAMGITSSGEPLIGVPRVEVTLESRGKRLAVAALNKPLGTAYGTGPRLYTREFRATLKSQREFRAVVIGKLSRRLPLPALGTVKGTVEEIFEGATEVPIPAGKLVLVEAVAGKDGGTTAGLLAGEKVKLRLSVELNGRKKIRDVVGGFPVLVEQGRKSIVGNPSESLALRRHPRTAVCFNERKIIFLVVDGRQPKLSVGMTLDELADFMVELGCTAAMNTDGGGSSVMAVMPPQEPPATAANAAGARYIVPLQIVNSPSDGQERGRGNAWIVIRKK